MPGLGSSGGSCQFRLYKNQLGAKNPRRQSGWLCAHVIGCALVLTSCERESAQSNPLPNPVSSLPYLDYAPIDEKNLGKSGVVLATDKAWPGVNLYGGRTETEALLVDMTGKVIKKWSSPDAKPQPPLQAYPYAADWVNESRGFTHVEMDESGNVYANVGLTSLTKFDSKGNVLWRSNEHVHHDLAIQPGDTTLLALTAQLRDVDYEGVSVPIMDDFFVTLDAKTGAKLSEQSLYDILASDPKLARILERNMRRLRDYVVSLRNSPQARRAPKKPTTKLELVVDLLGLRKDLGLPKSEQLLVAGLTDADISHSNNIEWLPATPGAVWAAGDLLLSMRSLDTIAILDLAQRRIKWSWGDSELGRQHNPEALPNGNILVFDNGWMKRDQSRVLEVSPKTGEIVWEYPRRGLCDPESRDSPEGVAHCFFSITMGAAQPLPNGNILITDARNGRAVEVTRDHEKVWEYFNPTRPELKDGFVGTIYRVTRLVPDACRDCD